MYEITDANFIDASRLLILLRFCHIPDGILYCIVNLL